MNDVETSAKSAHSGILIMAGNAIGCVADMPARALTALRDAELVIFEEDRPARAALKAAGIHRPYLKLNEHDSRETLTAARQALMARQTVVYMSDQGMPNVADPGQDLVAMARKVGARLLVIPGPSSITSALAAFPERFEQFMYAGFLPREAASRDAKLQNLIRLPMPVVILDAPYRLEALLDSIAKAAIGDTRVFVALDITGPDEQYLYGDAHEIAEKSKSLPRKLNFVLVVSSNKLR